MLQQLLALDAEESSRSHRQSRGLRGVRRRRPSWRSITLPRARTTKARMVAEDMCDMFGGEGLDPGRAR
jgi:hypothetical protein